MLGYAQTVTVTLVKLLLYSFKKLVTNECETTFLSRNTFHATAMYVTV